MEPVIAVVVGMGARATIYAQEALRHPDKLRIVGVADVNPVHVRMAQEMFHIPPERCFASADELAAVPRFADAAINGTMDPQHVETTIPLLRAGYDVLLEKPFATSQPEADRLLACAREEGRRVMVCHVLRYAPFYRRLKELILAGTLGRIINIRMTEQISYFHESVSYVRGKYASPELCGSGMLLSKCSHDLDLLAWLMAQSLPESVSSVGSLYQFRSDRAPEGAGTHCLLNCPIERTCSYSAKRLYLEHPQRWAANIWHDLGVENPTEAEKLRLLSKPDNPYSRCVYRCGLRIVDHQSVMIAFEDGATADFTMNGGAAKSSRRIHITGTKGEAAGRFEEERFTLSRIVPEAEGGVEQTTVETPAAEAGADSAAEQSSGREHGGGDHALVMDFVAMLRGEPTSVCSATLEDSRVGHRLAYLAEDSRERGGERMAY
ncbi:MAG TPA: Gfo/Idh/MocA family oxidoreductase [Candidatus Limiplasma sp.]|nr:Gfo/Idh/MocA family oxidoreductase [Candidatus Limiplasma sp.]